MTPIREIWFRRLCLLTAIANCVGNLGIVMFHRPLLSLVGAPPPTDFHTFTFESVLSFTMGVGAFLVWRKPKRNLDLLKVGIGGKGLFAIATWYFFAFHDLHWFYLVFGVWDLLYVVVFFLFLIQLQSPDLEQLHRGDLFAALPRDLTKKKALLIAFSLTGTGRSAVERLGAGLRSRGYSVDVKWIEPLEPLFRWPLTFWRFVWICVRAAFRRPARIAPLEISPSHDYDLLIVESQTWLLGISAPVQALFEISENRLIFEGRDAAALVVCRGAYRRSHAMLVRALERSGANVVGARAFSHEGDEPSRLLSLWFFLIFREPGRPKFLARFLQPYVGLSKQSLDQVEHFGVDLASRRAPTPTTMIGTEEVVV